MNYSLTNFLKSITASLFFAGFSALGFSQNRSGFDTMLQSVLEGNVETMSSKELKQKLGKEGVYLLDSREKDEYDVSHIKSAQHVGYENFDLENVAEYAKLDTIVVYCSIGKRSEEIATRLKEDGYKNVYNLYGGIFDWTNRGFPVVNNQNKEVKDIHPYNALWGIWINNYEKRYEPR